VANLRFPDRVKTIDKIRLYSLTSFSRLACVAAKIVSYSVSVMCCGTNEHVWKVL
jgi:hypothetical protein